MLEELIFMGQLDSLIEIDMIEAQYDAQKIYMLDQLVNNFDKNGFEIVKQRAQFTNQVKGSSELYSENQQLEDLAPKDVFLELIANHAYNDEQKKEILSAFDEIMEEVQHAEKSDQ